MVTDIAADYNSMTWALKTPHKHRPDRCFSRLLALFSFGVKSDCFIAAAVCYFNTGLVCIFKKSLFLCCH